MNALLYYLFVYPLSRLPLWLLYIIDPFLYFMLYRELRYRRTVVRENLSNSFPKHTREQLLSIEKASNHIRSVAETGINALTFFDLISSVIFCETVMPGTD